MTKPIDKPNPGSDEAVALGCICPRMDNEFGRGEGGLFYITKGCPVHPWVEEKPQKNAKARRRN